MFPLCFYLFILYPCTIFSPNIDNDTQTVVLTNVSISLNLQFGSPIDQLIIVVCIGS
jgi:hypothetical protein